MTFTTLFVRRAAALATAATAAVLAIQPVAAQDRGEPGPYGVLRAGAQLDSDLKLGKPVAPRTTRPTTPTPTPAPRPTPTPSPLQNSIDGNTGFTGEIGAGYDFGGFRLEGTVGYGSSSINEKGFSDRTNIGEGKFRSLDLGVAGYVDLNPGGRLNPFLGGGIGASRVSTDLSRLVRPVTTTPPTPTPPAANRPGTRIDDKDWGFRWHLDAGLGYEVAPGTTLELAGRYSRTSALEMRSSTRAVSGTTTTTTNNTFKPQLSSTSLTLGLRQRF